LRGGRHNGEQYHGVFDDYEEAIQSIPEGVFVWEEDLGAKHAAAIRRMIRTVPGVVAYDQEQNAATEPWQAIVKVGDVYYEDRYSHPGMRQSRLLYAKTSAAFRKKVDEGVGEIRAMVKVEPKKSTAKRPRQK